MKQQMLFVILMMLPALLISQATPAEAQDQHEIESEIRAAETSRFQALTAADLAALERTLSNDLVYTHASGWRQSKAEFLASVRSGELLYHSFASDDLKMHVYGDAVLVTGHAAGKVRAKGQELDVSLLYLEAYVKQDGRWQLAAWQSTRLGP
ncbi:MAG TPA: nuclear transport factor 2 family protein [Terriglobia bacterium]